MASLRPGRRCDWLVLKQSHGHQSNINFQRLDVEPQQICKYLKLTLSSGLGTTPSSSYPWDWRYWIVFKQKMMAKGCWQQSDVPIRQWQVWGTSLEVVSWLYRKMCYTAKNIQGPLGPCSYLVARECARRYLSIYRTFRSLRSTHECKHQIKKAPWLWCVSVGLVSDQ